MPTRISRVERRTLGRLVAASCIAGLAGCGSVPLAKVELDRSSPVRIQRIALLRVPKAPPLTVDNHSGFHVLGGLTGYLIQASIDKGHTEQYAKAAAAVGNAFSPTIAATIADALARDGYQVVMTDLAPRLAEDLGNVDLTGVRVDADAILAVWFAKVGYLAARSSLYRPCVKVKARMIDARSRSDMYSQTFSGGYDASNSPVEESVYVPSDPTYEYGSFEDLMASFEESLQGIDETAKSVAERIGTDLAPRPAQHP